MTVLVDLARHAVVAPARSPVRRRPRIAIAALVSAGLHIVLIGGVLLWMHRSQQVVLVPVENPATVELVMSPPGGKPAPAAAAPKEPPPAPETPPAPEKPPAIAAAPQAPPVPPAPTAQPAPAPDTPHETASAPQVPPVAPTPTEETAPAPETPQETASAPQAPPVTPAPMEKAAPAAAAPPPPAPPAPKPNDDKLTFDFAQAESDTNAWVTGSAVVPPSPDIKFRNRKPSYPMAAAQRGEQGTVILLIHVTADGLVTDVEVEQSSGFPALDHAAIDAVQTWHFMPSIRDGEPAPADVPFKFVFALD